MHGIKGCERKVGAGGERFVGPERAGLKFVTINLFAVPSFLGYSVPSSSFPPQSTDLRKP